MQIQCIKRHGRAAADSSILRHVDVERPMTVRAARHIVRHVLRFRLAVFPLFHLVRGDEQPPDRHAESVRNFPKRRNGQICVRRHDLAHTVKRKPRNAPELFCAIIAEVLILYNFSAPMLLEMLLTKPFEAPISVSNLFTLSPLYLIKEISLCFTVSSI